jgi:hypothetical protein
MMKGFAETGKKDLVKAAKTIKARLEAYAKPQADRAKQEEVQTQKDAINSTGKSASRGSTTEELSQLRRDVMMNKPGALAERLKRSGY